MQEHHQRGIHILLPRQHHCRSEGAKRNIHCDTAICTACMNINKLSGIKYWEGPGPPAPPVPTPMLILVCCLGNGVIFILHILFAALQDHRKREIKHNYMCHPVGCAWHIYENTGRRCIVVLFQKNSRGTRLGC